MLTYAHLLTRLREHADESYRAFHAKLLKNGDIRLMGVRTPILRALAREYLPEFDALMLFPDEYYEVTFLKCAAASLLPYARLKEAAVLLVPKLNNWATCDCFKPSCVKKHREDFFPLVKQWLIGEKEFTVRYGFVCLLNFYLTEEYLDEVMALVRENKDERYYVMMAKAWLVAEIIIKFYGKGLALLKEGALSVKTRNRAIQKARESFRLSEERKRELNALRR